MRTSPVSVPLAALLAALVAGTVLTLSCVAFGPAPDRSVAAAAPGSASGSPTGTTPRSRPAATEPRGIDVRPPRDWVTGRPTPVSVVVDAAAGSRVTEVVLHPSAGIVVAAAPPVDLTVGAADPRVEVSFSVRVRSRVSGSLTASAVLTGPHGVAETVRRVLYLAEESGSVLSSSSGPAELSLEVARRRRAGEEIRIYDRQVERIELGGAGSSVATVGHAGTNLAVDGRAAYLDATGRAHPVRFARVALVNPTAQTEYRASTDGSGRFQLDIPAAARARCLACRLRVVASYPGVTVQDVADSLPWGIETRALDLRRAGRVEVRLTANRVADNNTAFSVGDALVTAHAGLSTLGLPELRPLVVDYPTTRLTSSFNPGGDGLLHVLRGDRFDWDVVQHEFGHFVEESLGLTAGVQGGHVIGQGQAAAHGITKGEQLAWSEGFATWFAVAVQRVTDAGVLNIPAVGDDDYTDTEDVSPPITYSVAREERALPGRGPDDELTVQRTLFGLAFGDPAAGWAPRGASGLMRTIVAGRVTSLPQLLARLLPRPSGTCAPERQGSVLAPSGGCDTAIRAGCVAAEHGAGPRLVAAARWTPGWTAGPSGPERLTAFRLVVFDADGNPVAVTPLTDRTTAPLPAGTRAVLRAGGELVIFGWRSDGSAAGRFASCPLGAGPGGLR